MSNEPFTSGDFDNDWAKERQFMELRTEEMIRPQRRRRQWNLEAEAGEERREVERDNAVAVDLETHRYDEQNN